MNPHVVLLLPMWLLSNPRQICSLLLWPLIDKSCLEWQQQSIKSQEWRQLTNHRPWSRKVIHPNLSCNWRTCSSSSSCFCSILLAFRALTSLTMFRNFFICCCILALSNVQAQVGIFSVHFDILKMDKMLDIFDLNIFFKSISLFKVITWILACNFIKYSILRSNTVVNSFMTRGIFMKDHIP